MKETQKRIKVKHTNEIFKETLIGNKKGKRKFIRFNINSHWV